HGRDNRLPAGGKRKPKHGYPTGSGGIFFFFFFITSWPLPFHFLPYGTLARRLGWMASSSRSSCVLSSLLALAASSFVIRCARSSLSLAFFCLILSRRCAVLPPPPALFIRSS